MKKISEFDLSARQSTGGVTGSARVKEKTTQLNYQLKPSILDNPSKLRQIKARGTDRENFGEVIASQIGQALLGKEAVPEVSLVYDDETQHVSVASKYLVGSKVRTLDDYAKEVGLSLKKGHAIFVAGRANAEKQQLSLDGNEMLPLKKSLAEAIVLSAMVGDHDVNPGNMMVITDTNGISRVARIDFGHAFNDLLNAPKALGGQLHNNNAVLDFFNRKKVAGIKAGSPSKLWRDYPGLVPSQEIVDALNSVSKNTTAGINAAKAEFAALLLEMGKNKDESGIQHVLNSLAAIYKNVTNQPLDTSKLGIEVLSDAFHGLERVIQKNIEQTTHVANVMQLQVDIDNMLKHGTPLTDRAFALLTKENLPTTKRGKIQWVKIGPSGAFIGSIDDYIAHRASQLSKRIEHRDNILANLHTLKERLPHQDRSQEHTHFYKTRFSVMFQDKNTAALNKAQKELLISELKTYINERATDVREKKGKFSKHTREDKIIAASALISALQGRSTDVSSHQSALKEGQLGALIRNCLPDHSNIATLLKQINDEHQQDAPSPENDAPDENSELKA